MTDHGGPVNSANADSANTCFVIAPIGDRDSPDDRSNQLLKFVINPAATSCGFTAIRADELAEPGLITIQVINHLMNDDVVVADLSDHNPNVYYELGIRHTVGKPSIHLMTVGQLLPFNVVPTRTIYYDHRNLEHIEHAKADLARQLIFARDHPDRIDSPVKYVRGVSALNSSASAENSAYLAMMGMMEGLQSEFSQVRAGLQSELSEIRNMIYRETGRTAASVDHADLRELLLKNLEEKKLSRPDEGRGAG